MQKLSRHKAALLSLALLFPTMLQAWGFWGHRHINKMAVYALPPELMGFYKAHIDYISAHAVDPDKRRYSVKEEAPRHYIDLDQYLKNERFDSIPHYWQKAVKKYTEDTLNAHGIVPWHVQLMYAQLRDAFKQKNQEKILYFSANIGHYIADACVPLHTSSNYNGQKTNQKGIHGLWESAIPEKLGENYDFWVGKAKALKSPAKTIFSLIAQSNAALDTVFEQEKRVSMQLPSDQKYTFRKRGKKQMRMYSPTFIAAYNDALDGMVERRMRVAIYNVASFWYSAWIDAGKPKLNTKEELKIDLEEATIISDSLQTEHDLKIKGHED